MTTKSKRVALVTGSTSGIGLATAKALAKEGCHVVLTGFGTPEEIDAIREGIERDHGVNVNYIGCDLRDVSDIQAMVTEIFKLYPDGLDILVNNAGFNHVCTVDQYPDDKWNDMIAVLLTAPFHLTKQFIPAMKNKGWGRIVNISSAMGLISAPGKAVYSAAKSGLVGLTKGVALEVADCGITCNAVCPTYALTDIVKEQIVRSAEENGRTYEQEKALFAARSPVNKLITTEQIADFVRYLCLSVTSPMMTGAAYLLDGGYTAQ